MDNEKENYLDKYLYDENIPEEEITKRQWQIIDAAIKIFSEKGFEGSRTSEIAKEADVAEGTIFRYYKTKKDILIGLLIPLITKFFRPLMFMSIEKLLKNSEDRPIEDVLKDVFIDRMELANNNFPLVKTVIMESAYHPELLDPIKKEIMPKIIPVVDEFFAKNTQKGEFRDIDPRVLTRSMMASFIGYFVLSRSFPDTFGGKEDIEEVPVIIDIMMNGLKNKEREDK